MMSALTITTTLTNGHGHVNGQLDTGLNGYRKNGFVKQEIIDRTVSTYI